MWRMSVTRNKKSNRVLAIALLLAPACLTAGPVSAEQRTDTLKHAATLIAGGELAAAESPLQALLKQDPSDAVVLNLLGLIRLQQHQDAEAEALFLRAIQTRRGIAGPHINLARLYGQQRPLEAIEHLQTALELAPGNASAEALLRSIAKSAALVASQSGDPRKAAEVLAKAQAALPNDRELSYERGMVALQGGDFKVARTSFEEALKAAPDYAEALYGLARADLELNLASQAEEQMRRYLEARPRDASARYGLGYILMAEQKPEAAQEQFERSLSLEPDQTESLFQLGEIALEQDRRPAAQEDYAKVLTRNPHHAGALTGLAILAYRASNFEQARTYCEQAIAATPGYQKAHYYYALTLSRLGRKPEADREFAAARRLQKPHMGMVDSIDSRP